MMHLLRKLSQPFIWRLYKWYLSSPKWYNYKGIEVRLLPTVFHPGWLVSTQTLLRFLSGWDLNGKSVLELGAGSGLISLYASNQGALTTATDINPLAIQAMKESAQKNNLKLSIIESDLFEKIGVQHFDLIIINPPYFPKDPVDYWEKAFYCGSNFEYFHKLFDQIKPYCSESTKTIMILNEHCNIEAILAIASKYALTINLLDSPKISREKQYIFEIYKKTN
ncbi:MAG: methyltransferase [Saprospiraceae bacterium]|nr:methyltransferase [Saprospiraceae bacterium]